MTILVLGPSTWLPGGGPPHYAFPASSFPPSWPWPGPTTWTPLDLRVAVAYQLSQRGVPSIVMEAEEPRTPANNTAKFLELVRKHWVEDYFICWPFGAARPGLDVEVGFLLLQMGRGELPSERVTVFYENDNAGRRAASLTFDTGGRLQFDSLERDGRRTRYYPDLVDFGAVATPWSDPADLFGRALARAGVGD